MKPTIGRVVIFHFSDIKQNNNSVDAPAIITHVWSETCVNLKVLNDGPENSWKTSIMLGDTPECWSWPTIVK